MTIFFFLWKLMFPRNAKSIESVLHVNCVSFMLFVKWYFGLVKSSSSCHLVWWNISHLWLFQHFSSYMSGLDFLSFKKFFFFKCSKCKIIPEGLISCEGCVHCFVEVLFVNALFRDFFFFFLKNAFPLWWSFSFAFLFQFFLWVFSSFFLRWCKYFLACFVIYLLVI